MEQIFNFLILKESDRFSFNIIPRSPLRPDHPLEGVRFQAACSAVFGWHERQAEVSRLAQQVLDLGGRGAPSPSPPSRARRTPRRG